jgi:hypothetical protein
MTLDAVLPIARQALSNHFRPLQIGSLDVAHRCPHRIDQAHIQDAIREREVLLGSGGGVGA